MAPFDVVRITAGLPEAGIPPGALAVILDVYEEPALAYEVEVVGEAGETLFAGAVEAAWVELETKVAPDD